MSDIVAKAGGVTPESYVKGASLKRQLTEDELKRMETLLALSGANKQSRDSIGVALMNVKDYSVGIDLEKGWLIRAVSMMSCFVMVMNFIFRSCKVR